MIEGDVEVLYEDDEIKVVRITWMIGKEHGEKIITDQKR